MYKQFYIFNTMANTIMNDKKMKYLWIYDWLYESTTFIEYVRF